MTKHEIVKQNLIASARKFFIQFGFEKTIITEIRKTIHMTLKAAELPLLFDYERKVFTKRLNSLINISFNEEEK